MTTDAVRRPVNAADIVLRVIAVAGLAISSYAHFHTAHFYASRGDSITQGQLFYVQGSLAAVVALLLLVTGWRLAWWAAAAIGAASVTAVLLYYYVNVGSIGPLPNMYDHTWFPKPDKALSAFAEGAVVVAWLAHEGFTRRARPQP